MVEDCSLYTKPYFYAPHALPEHCRGQGGPGGGSGEGGEGGGGESVRGGDIASGQNLYPDVVVKKIREAAAADYETPDDRKLPYTSMKFSQMKQYLNEPGKAREAIEKGFVTTFAGTDLQYKLEVPEGEGDRWSSTGNGWEARY